MKQQKRPLCISVSCAKSATCWLAIVVCALGSAAIANATDTERQLPSEHFGGVVTNQTITAAGQDFYRHFTSMWHESDLSERFSISIHEQPSARWGSRIWVEYAQRRIFQASLPTARAAIRVMGDQAVAVVQQKITDAEVERLLFRHPDLGADEL